MQNKLYLECFSGISGDMTVAALLDLGADQIGLLQVLENLPVQGFNTKIQRIKKSGLDCLDFDVILDKEHQNHDHDMAYLYNYTNKQNYNDAHINEHPNIHHHEHYKHHHEHTNTDHHEHNKHHHEHRCFNEIKEIISNSTLTENAKHIAIRIFEIIAHAEAKAHGESFDEVHFHEVGAVDSIVDIISVAYCIDNLEIDEVIVPYLCEGHGNVRCQHGILPIPVPAVSNIVTAHQISLKLINIDGELVTPTGAAIVAALRTTDKLPEIFTIDKIGLGSGKRDYGLSGILRAMLITSSERE